MTSQAGLRMFPILKRETQRKLLQNEPERRAEAALLLLRAAAGPPSGNHPLQGPCQTALLFGYTAAASQDKSTTSNNAALRCTWLVLSNGVSSQAELSNNVCSQNTTSTRGNKKKSQREWKNNFRGSPKILLLLTKTVLLDSMWDKFTWKLQNFEMTTLRGKS